MTSDEPGRELERANGEIQFEGFLKIKDLVRENNLLRVILSCDSM